jgi:hypothetical protein
MAGSPLVVEPIKVEPVRKVEPARVTVVEPVKAVDVVAEASASASAPVEEEVVAEPSEVVATERESVHVTFQDETPSELERRRRDVKGKMRAASPADSVD